MKYIPLIIVLLLILAILVLVFYGVSRVKRFSRQLFGTDDIIQGVKKAQEDAASTPRSVSAMTRIALPQIVSDFPDFQYDEIKQGVKKAARRKCPDTVSAGADGTGCGNSAGRKRGLKGAAPFTDQFGCFTGKM